MDERQAIIRLKQGDVSSLESLVRLYQVRALEVAFLTCRDYNLAEDIVQSAFLKLYQRIHQFDENRPFWPWLVRTVVNDTLMALRSASIRRQVSLDNDGELEKQSGDQPEQETLFRAIEAAETREAIWQALDRMSAGQRTAIVMRYYMNMSNLEISQALGCPPGTVGRRMHDARASLRRLLPAWISNPVDE